MASLSKDRSSQFLLLPHASFRLAKKLAALPIRLCAMMIEPIIWIQAHVPNLMCTHKVLGRAGQVWSRQQQVQTG